MGDTISVQSTVETSITDIDSPLENLVEEIAEETEMEIMEDVTGIGSSIGSGIGLGIGSGIGTGIGSGIGNIAGNMEVLSENIEEAVESSLMNENIITDTGSTLISPAVIGSEIIEEAIAENIGETISSIPYGNLPSTSTLSTMEELEIMSDIGSIIPTSGPLSSVTSQIGRNYVSPMMGSMSGNQPPNMPYPPNMRPSTSISTSGGNYMSPMMESLPGMGTSSSIPSMSNIRPSSITSTTGSGYIPPLMESPGMGTSLPSMSNIRPSSITSTGGNYISPLMESVSGVGNSLPNMPYPSMQQLQSQIGRPASNMPYLENMPPLMPGSSGMYITPMSSMQEMDYELDYDMPGPMGPMGPMYRPGLLSPITSTIKDIEDEIEESSIPLMNLVNQSPLMPQFSGPVLSLPSLGSTLEELEDVTTSSVPLLGTLTGGGSYPMRPNAPNMLQDDAFLEVPGIGSTLMNLEQGMNSVTRPLMETMPIIGNSLPLLQRPPSMGGYSSNILNKENMQPFGPLSPGMGYPSGSRLPFINSVMAPFQNLPLMKNIMSPLTNLSNMQPMMPGSQQPMTNLLSPLRQAMTSLKRAPGLLQQPLIPNMPNVGPNSMMSNVGLSELTSLIDQDSMLPSSQKSQFINEMSSMGPSSLMMLQNMYSMMGNDWQSRLRRKIERVRQARRELMMAVEAFMTGHPEEVTEYIMAAIAALGSSPMTTALQYALNQDRNSLPLIANMSRLILDRIQ